MDIVYNSNIINRFEDTHSSMKPECLDYMRSMINYITHISHDIFKKVSIKTIDSQIDDLLITQTYIKKIKSVSISAIILCFNEERCIERCIKSIQECLFDEIIVIDTGSTDRTIEILRGLQKKIINLYIYTIPWENDFSRVRNYGIDVAQSEWVFFIDADEYYLNETDHSIKEIVTYYSIYYNGHLCICPNIINSNNHQLYNNTRIFKKNSGYRYYGNVHELLRKNGNINEFVPHIGLDIRFGHDGYQKDVYLKKDKQNRNINLLQKCIELEPSNPLWKCYLARDGIKQLSKETLIQLCKEAIILCEGKKTYFFSFNYYWAHFMLIDIYIDMKEVDKAIPLLEVIKKNPLDIDESDIYYREQLIYLIKVEGDLNAKLIEVKEYRKQHLQTKLSSLNTEGYHLDDLIMRLHYLNHNMDEYQKYKDLLFDLHYLIEI